MWIRVRHGGSGPAVVLLHGHPRTHTTWYAVAARLADAGFTVICPDLCGHGGSGKPVTNADRSPCSKRALAGDIVGLMDVLGHQQSRSLGTIVARTSPTGPHWIIPSGCPGWS
jgi:haloacetate dehalogenase